MGMILPSELQDTFSRYRIHIQQECLCGACRALVKKRPNGYLILVEESLSFDATLEAVKHELYHIANEDLDRDDSVEDIEAENPY